MATRFSRRIKVTDKLEKDEEKVVKTWCKDVGIVCIKFTPMGETGWPDRIVQVNSHTLWIEMKKKGKTPRKIQHYRMNQLREEGANVNWFDNGEKCIEWIRSFM